MSRRSEGLEGIREFLAAEGFDVGLFAHDDAYGNSFLPAAAETLRQLSGFSGSAGLAAITKKDATLFVDGRYGLQAKAQVKKGFKVVMFTKKSLSAFFSSLSKDKGKGKDKGGGKDKNKVRVRVGFDGFRHSVRQIAHLKSCAAKGGTLGGVRAGGGTMEFAPFAAPPFAAPPPPRGKFFIDEKAATDFRRKISSVTKVLARRKAAAVVITAPTSVGWLLNFRAHCNPYSAVAPSRAVVTARRVTLFSPTPPPPPIRRHWGRAVECCGEGEFLKFLGEIKGKVLVDKTSAPYAVWAGLKNRGAVTDPCLTLKAVKTAAEIEGIKSVHIRDGAALSQFLYSLENDKLPADELQAAHRLRRLRAADPLFWGESFPTISAIGTNSALPHYIPLAATAAPMRDGNVYLIDSGGHYLDGTTDVTRTLWLGRSPPPPLLKHAYTLVLKGHINLATVKMTPTTDGERLDAAARRPLKRHGLDYPHSTGHGVGNFLSVHEFPPLIAKGGGVVKAGMVFSNEPALYFKGRYGIRLENLQVAAMPKSEPLTQVPFESSLIVNKVLTKTERAWLNRYHAEVYENLFPLMPPKMLDWLAAKTARLKSPD